MTSLCIYFLYATFFEAFSAIRSVGENVILKEIPKPCVDLKIKMVHSGANFESCKLMNGVDNFTLCETCIDAYTYLIASYRNIKMDKNCSDVLLHANTKDMITDTYDNAVRVWTGAFCEGCFECAEDDEKCDFKYKLSADAVLLLEMVDNLTQCLNADDAVVHHNICVSCAVYYSIMNEKFDNLTFKANDLVCADLVAKVGKMRAIWSQCPVGSIKRSMAGVVVVGSITALYTVVFYVLMPFCAKRRKVKFFIAKRMSKPNFALISPVVEEDTAINNSGCSSTPNDVGHSVVL